MNNLRVLITAGGCEEPIDHVRSISNFSTGRTGAAIADAFTSKGWDVELIKGRRANMPQTLPQSRIHSFAGWRDLEGLMKDRIGEFQPDVFIHAAAVSDFEVAKITHEGKEYLPGHIPKIDSRVEGVHLTLRRTPKLISSLHRWTMDMEKPVLLIGFKLTSNSHQSERKTKSVILAKTSHLDFVVSNDLSEISPNEHHFSIYEQSGSVAKTGKSKTELSAALAELIEQKTKAAAE